jgi:hypothetical protein
MTKPMRFIWLYCKERGQHVELASKKKRKERGQHVELASKKNIKNKAYMRSKTADV